MRVDDLIAELMTESGDRLLRLAFQLCHNRAEAEDLVQEALTRVYGSWLRRRPDVESAPAYVRRAIVNEYLRTRRLRRSTEIVTDTLPEQPDDGFADRVADADRVWAALGALPRRQRAVLVLRYYEDLPDRDIAAAIGAREATVRSLAARGLQALRGGHLAEERS